MIIYYGTQLAEIVYPNKHFTYIGYGFDIGTSFKLIVHSIFFMLAGSKYVVKFCEHKFPMNLSIQRNTFSNYNRIKFHMIIKLIAD